MFKVWEWISSVIHFQTYIFLALTHGHPTGLLHWNNDLSASEVTMKAMDKFLKCGLMFHKDLKKWSYTQKKTKHTSWLTALSTNKPIRNVVSALLDVVISNNEEAYHKTTVNW